MVSHLLWAGALTSGFGLLAQDSLRFEPDPGLELRVQLETISVLEQISSSHLHTVNGVRGEAIDPEVDSRIEEQTSVVLRERFERWDSEEGSRVERLYEELSQVSASVTQARGQGQREREDTAESELEGRRVVLTRAPDAEDFDARFDDEGDEDLPLANLDVATHLAFLLPDASGELPELGTEWELPTGSLGRVLNPAGEVQLEFDIGSFPIELLEKSPLEWSEEEGRAELVSAEGGRAHIELRLEGASELKTEFSHGQLQALSTGTLSSLRRNVYELEGRLTWDLESNRPIALELSGDHTRVETGVQRSQGPEESLEMETIQEYEGTFEVSLELTEIVR